jgi:pimeloyl-ACP methyl ester carboxylesterase
LKSHNVDAVLVAGIGGRPLISLAEKIASRGSGPMWDSTQSSDLTREIRYSEVPVFLFSGRNDYNASVQLVEEYFKILDAPKGKELVIFEKSSHAPFMGEPEKFNQELVRVKEKTYQLH